MPWSKWKKPQPPSAPPYYKKQLEAPDILTSTTPLRSSARAKQALPSTSIRSGCKTVPRCLLSPTETPNSRRIFAHWKQPPKETSFLTMQPTPTPPNVTTVLPRSPSTSTLEPPLPSSSRSASPALLPTTTTADTTSRFPVSLAKRNHLRLHPRNQSIRAPNHPIVPKPPRLCSPRLAETLTPSPCLITRLPSFPRILTKSPSRSDRFSTKLSPCCRSNTPIL